MSEHIKEIKADAYVQSVTDKGARRFKCDRAMSMLLLLLLLLILL